MPTSSSPASSETQLSPIASRPITVVTGGSDGIGLAIARVLAGRGNDLLLVARTAERLEETARSLRGPATGGVAILALDLVRGDACQRLDAELERLGGHVELLVNAAGIGLSGDFAEVSSQDLHRLVALNVEAPGRLMRHVLPGMRQRGRGGIINIASLGGYVPGPHQAAYYASKAYLISLSEAVAAEVRPHGVRVTVVAPGPVETEFHAKMDANNAFYRRLLPSSTPESVARWAVRGFDLGLKVVVPGVFNVLSACALRLTPHILLVPLMAWLLDPRRTK
ncbi:MAG: SDR family NAD(P)-dependent oxidoreductase [Hyphomicrobiaceae bacterium]